MVAADLARVLLPAVLSVWHDNVAVAYAVAFGLSAGQVFFSPAAQSLLPAVVGDDELVAANSGIWTAAVTAQVLVAPVAAVIAVRCGVRRQLRLVRSVCAGAARPARAGAAHGRVGQQPVRPRS